MWVYKFCFQKWMMMHSTRPANYWTNLEGVSITMNRLLVFCVPEPWPLLTLTLISWWILMFWNVDQICSLHFLTWLVNHTASTHNKLSWVKLLVIKQKNYSIAGNPRSFASNSSNSRGLSYFFVSKLWSSDCHNGPIIKPTHTAMNTLTKPDNWRIQKIQSEKNS